MSSATDSEGNKKVWGAPISSVSLARIVEVATAALEAEDRLWLGAVASNPAYSLGSVSSNPPGGLLGRGVLNERYFQFVVARALASAIPFRIQPELKSHDLVLLDRDKSWFAVIEMKCYISKTGNREREPITADVKKLICVENTNPTHLWMMVFASYPAGEGLELRRRNLEDIESYIKNGDAHCLVSAHGLFHTFDQYRRPAEFLVSGFEISGARS